jgi:hypothetical protein
MITLVLLSLPLAYLTWRFIEKPFRNKDFISLKQVFSISALCSLFFISFGLFGYFTNGYYGRDNYAKSFAKNYDITRINYGLSEDCNSKYNESDNCKTSNAPEIIVWGDSYAMHLVNGIISSNPNVKLIQKTVSVCGPFFDIAPYKTPNYGVHWGKSCIETNDKVREFLKHSKTIKYAVLSSPFQQYTTEDSRLLTRDGKIINGKDQALFYFQKTLQEIESLGIKPIIFSPPPENGNNIAYCLLKANLFNVDKNKCNFDLKISNQRNNEIITFLKTIEEKRKVVWLSQGICPQNNCKASINNISIYRDAGHLSYEGSELIGKHMGFYDLIIDQQKTG